MRTVRLGLIGDYDPDVIAHQGIERTLALSRTRVPFELEWSWLHTGELAEAGYDRVADFAGLWCVPATPYASMQGALEAIRFAREHDVPFLGTCGGFQHALIEYARNVLGISSADHAETNSEAADLIVTPLACALVEETGRVFLREGSRIREICGVDRMAEGYHCSFGLNPEYRDAFERSGLRFGAHDEDGAVRSFELTGHRFYMGTLFQPERLALRDRVHPVCTALLLAAAGHAVSRGENMRADRSAGAASSDRR